MAPAAPERRAADRRPSRLKTPCRLMRATEEGPWLATVRNISGRGIGLIVDQPFQPGMLLTVELPSTTKKPGQPKLLRVRHVKPQVDAKWWSLGGVFAEPLTREELDALRARSPALVPRTDRRTGIRHTTRLKLPCRLLRMTEEGPWTATVRNVSPTGIGLIADRPFKAGTILTVEFPLKSRTPKVLRVMHTRTQPGNKWSVLGCFFAGALDKTALQTLLGI